MSMLQSLVRSRWGFHPCDYQTYRKLKLLNLVYQRAVRLAHAWNRWKRKDPHNRVIRRRRRNAQGQTIGYDPPLPLAEPGLCPLFSHKLYEKCYIDKLGMRHKDGFLDERVATDDIGIPADYAAARKPVPQAGELRPLSHTLAEIDVLYEKARSWVERQDVS
jgi:hypothetical protein